MSLQSGAVSFFERSAVPMAVVLAVVSLAWWMAYDATTSLQPLVPGMDGRPEGPALDTHESISIGALFSTFDGVAGVLPGRWPKFRGADSKNIVTDATPLAASWPDGGPPVLWSLDLGEGHAGAAVADGRVYLLDYDETEGADALRCFSLDDGREIWRRWYRVRVKRNHGLSRTVPAIGNGVVVTIGPRCHVMAVDAVTGDLLWGLDLERDFGTTTPFWYTGQCPLIDENVAVIAPAGSVLMMGVDSTTGDVLWQTPNAKGWQMSHTSVMPMTFGGRRMYVYSAVGGLVGVAADGDDRGTILWQSELWSQSVLAPSPLILPDGRIFVTAGYGAGSMMLRLEQAAGGFELSKLLEYKPSSGLASEQQTPLFFDGHLISIQPKDAGELREQLLCVSPDDCSTPRWASGAERFGLGPFLVADGKLLVLDDDGTLTMARASTSDFRVLAQAKVLAGHDAWAPMALAGTRLLLRDSKRLVCLNLGEGSSS